MNLIKNLLGSRNKGIKKQFLAGNEVVLDGKEQCSSFIETQIIDEKTEKNIVASLQTCIALTFDKNNVLSDCKLYVEGIEKKSGGLYNYLKAEQALGVLVYEEHIPHNILTFEHDDDGIHYLGGEIPDNFKIPTNHCPGSFQYLGMISNKDVSFQWLPFDIHLTYPIYLDVDDVIWLDYSNPQHPKIINTDIVEKGMVFHEAVKQDSFIFFEKFHFKAAKTTNFSSEYSNRGGVPLWIQFPEIPRCPKTNKTMRFLCSLGSGGYTSRTNIEIPSDSSSGYLSDYFKQMQFFGDLYIFFEPTSKIACYFTQNT